LIQSAILYASLQSEILQRRALRLVASSLMAAASDRRNLV
jgi:hypothetical protein